MPQLRTPCHAVLISLFVFTAVAFGLVWSTQPVLAAGPADAQAKELVRLINGERAYLGKRALKVDTFLASKARDGAVACPNDASLVMSGRAKDWAVYGYPSNSHMLRLCPKYSSLDAMRTWGYNTYRGEVTAVNGGFGTGAHAYTYGCSPTVRTCAGATTSSYYTSVRAVAGWVSSATHYAVIVGNYDRIGCGGWVGSNGAFYYDCLVSKGGRTASRTSSRSAAKPAATPTPTATPIPLLTEPPQIVVFTPVPEPSESVSPEPSEAVQAALDAADQDAPPPAAAQTTRDVSLAAGAAAAALSLGYGLFLNVKRRRRQRRASD